MIKRDGLLLTWFNYPVGNVTVFPYITVSFPYKAPWLNLVIWIPKTAKSRGLRLFRNPTI